jgi:DNA-binding transcriptional regulator LsrR (DeoR family)
MKQKPSVTIPQHYTPEQIAEKLCISKDKARRMFANEPGVVKIGNPSRRLGRVLKRRYYTLRIPESVAERVIARMTTKK